VTPDNRNLTQRTIAGMLWLASGKAAYAGLQLIVLAVLARLVTPADFGVVSAALVVIAFSAIVSQLGLGPALVQRADLEPRHVDTAFTASVLFGLVLGAALWVAAPAVAGFFRTADVAPVMRALAWVFPLQGLGITAESLARRDLRFRWLALLDAKAYGLGYGVVGVGLALAGWGVWALVAGEISESLFRSAILLRSRPPRLRPTLERRALRELLYFGSGFTVAKVANFFAVNGDNLVVGRMLGPAALGLYGRAYQLMSAPAASFGTVLDNALFPVMARVQHDLPRLRMAYRHGIALVAVVVLPVTVALFLLAPEFVHVVLGPRWGDVVLPFQILAAGMVLHTTSKLGDSLVRATGAVYRRAWRQGVFAALVIAGSLIGQRWGIVGVAGGAMFALSINFLLMAQLSVSMAEMPWRDFWGAHLPALLVAAVSAPIAWGTATALRHQELPPLLVLSAAGGLALVVALLLIWRFPWLFLGKDVRWMLDTLRGMAPGGPGGPGGRGGRGESQQTGPARSEAVAGQAR